MPKSTNAGLYGYCIFNFTRNCQTVFPEWRYHSTLPPACIHDLVSPHLLQHLLLLLYFYIGYSERWACYLPVALGCMSLMTNNIELLFMCIFAVHSLVKCLFVLFAHFIIGLCIFFFFKLSLKSSLCILETCPLLGMGFANTLSIVFSFS